MTKIFKSYNEFRNRKNKNVNGVSQEFALKYPDYKQDNKNNVGCWNCFNCSDCSGCHGCSDCSRCSRCSRCRNCCSLKNTYNKKVKSGEPQPPIPFIKDLHKKVYEVTKNSGCLDMSTWHTCQTTHCRAGWVVTLAGEEGKKLEEFHNTALAAMLIYDKSCPGYKINPCRFYDSDEDALQDIKRLAGIDQ